MVLPARARDEGGETLLELVLSVVILAICVVAIGTGITLSVKISDIHRKQAVAQEFLHNYAETIQSSPYVGCTSSPNYAAGLPAPANGGPWKPVTSSVQFWNRTSSTFGPSCTVDQGLELVTLTLQSNDGFVNERLDFVVRNPAVSGP